MTLTIKVPLRLNARLEAEARRRRVSKSQLTREGIERVLKERPAGRLSALDLVRDLAGSLRGPKDLSTNPKYMEGFGE